MIGDGCVYRRCGCADPATGQQYGRTCQKLAAGGMAAYPQAPTDHQKEHPTGPQPASLPQRSADQARSRLSGFQLGSRDAEASTLSAEEGARP